MSTQFPNYEDIVLDTKILSYIVDIVDEGCLTKAAEKNFLTQPSLSRYLHNLEESIGTPIFTKKHNRLELTKAGIVFLNGARSILHIEQDTLKRMQQKVRTDAGIIRIAAPSTLKRLLQNAVPEWNSGHSETPIQVFFDVSDAIVDKLTGKEYDFGILLESEHPSGSFSYARLRKTHLALFLPAESVPLHGKDPAKSDLRALRQERFLLCTHDSFLRNAQEYVLDEAGIPHPNIAACADLDLLEQLVRDGYGYTFLPIECASSVDERRVVELSPPFLCQYTFLWRRNAPQSCVSSTLVLFLQSFLESCENVATPIDGMITSVLR